ncbi:MAG: DUF1549 domain-containing protein, partial [Candidatus Omnitrophica bacterium]|nr:DUF1549 domain-containing protein [Candidatus Omnitrophota bacterium]
LQKQLAEAESERENLRSRLDALNVALILLDEHPSGESVTALAKTEETAPPQTLADVQGNEIPIITRTVEFETEIYPIFQQRCFECHGPDKHRGQLRLDAREVVLKKGDNAGVIKPGHGDRSAIFRRIAGLDGEDQMPPVGEKLSVEQMALIRAWIDQGANWPEGLGSDAVTVAKHWSYIPPQRPEIPEVQKKDWPKNPIDSFILSRLESEGFSPQREANKGTLLRRVSLDLIGLPPTPAELDAYLEDDSPDAYEKAVDRLLASPHYGERWARIWLDLARYADTNGYEKDLRREMWPWRDWVIRAFNQNMPFDQFTIEQIAGDLLPNPSRDQLIATGFHRNTMLNDEGGIDPEEFRIVAVKDRVDTTGAVWLGTTIGCAQCHDHKFDPFSQKEYYQFMGFFNSTVDVGKGQEPVLELPTPEQEKEREGLRAEVARLEGILGTQTPELDDAFEVWERDIDKDVHKWTILQPERYSSTEGSTLTQLEDQSLLAIGKNPDNDRYEIEATLPVVKPTGIRLEVLTHETLPNGGPGRKDNGGFVIDRLDVSALSADEDETPIQFSDAYADYTEDSFDIKSLVRIVEGRGWATSSSQEGQRVNRVAIFKIADRSPLEMGEKIRFVLSHAYGRGHNLGRFRISVTDDPNPLKQNDIPAEVQSILALAPDARNATQTETLKAHFRSVTPLLQEERGQLVDTKNQLASLDIPTTMVMKDLDEPRETHVLSRGNFMAPEEEVQPDVPRIL